MGTATHLLKKKYYRAVAQLDKKLATLAILSACLETDSSGKLFIRLPEFADAAAIRVLLLAEETVEGS